MDIQLFVICFLTFGIHLIGALAYSARIAGVRTRRIAMSFALFNVLVLVSRLSNRFLGPFLAKRIENAPAAGTGFCPRRGWWWWRPPRSDPLRPGLAPGRRNSVAASFPIK